MDAMMHEEKEEKYEKDDKSKRMSHNDGGIDAGRLIRRQRQTQNRGRETRSQNPSGESEIRDRTISGPYRSVCGHRKKVF